MADEFDLTSPDDLPEDIALENVLQDLGATDRDVKIMLYRTGAKYHGKMAFLAQMAPAEFSLDNVREAFGPGEYRVHVRGKNESGKNSILANKVILIEESKRDAAKVAAEPLRELQTVMVTGFQELGKLIAAAVVARPEIPAPPPMGTKEILEMLVQLRQLDRREEPPRENPMEYLLKGIELAKNITPRESEPSNAEVLLEGLRTLGGPIAQALMKNVAAPSGVPGPVPVSAPVSVRQPAIAPDAAGEEMLKLYVKQLIAKAKAGGDPGLYADLMLDNMAREEIEALISGDWFGRLEAMCPEAATVRPWLESLRSMLADALTPDTESGTEESGGEG